MNKVIVSALCSVAAVLSGCSSQQDEATAEASGSGIFNTTVASVPETCEGGGIVTNDEVSVTGSVDLRSAPSDSADKMVNEKATSAIGETVLQQVDNSERLKEICRQKDWSKVQVLEPDRLTHVNGWVPVKSLRAIQRATSGKRTFVEADFTWDDDTAPYKPKLVAAVNRIVRENDRCPTIDPGTLSKSGNRGTAAKPVFYVTCQGEQPFNVWFEPEAAANRGKSFAAARNIGQADAVQACERAAKQAANNPQTVDFSRFMDVAFVSYANGNSRLISSFTAKNAFEVEGKFRIECFFEGGTMTEQNISERRG